MTADLPVREGNAGLPPRDERLWWRDAVVYQIYPRSFSDSDGDGLGDLPGIRARLPYIADLGVDAIWLSPFYPSPLLDGGYDVADPRDVDPRLGTLDDARAMVAEAHELGLRVFVDVVPNHFSWDHPWFKAAMKTAPGSPEWGRFHALRGKGENGELPPNNWVSAFGGSAWTPIEGHPGWWYLHLFDDSQPDVNWENPEIHEDYATTLRFWFDMGVDGFRIDVAHSLIKAPGYPDGPEPDSTWTPGNETGPAWDQPRVHDVWREWRRLADTYDPPRAFVGEAWVRTTEAQAAYTRPDELHTTFNFHFLKAYWDADVIRDVIGTSLLTSAAVGAPPTWVLSNHDVWRPVTRFAPWLDSETIDVEAGRRRALAMSLLSLALPGSAYLNDLNARVLPKDVPITAIVGAIGEDAGKGLNDLIDSPAIRKFIDEKQAAAARSVIAQAITDLGDGVVSETTQTPDGVTDVVHVPGFHRTILKTLEVEKSVRDAAGVRPKVAPAIPVIVDRLSSLVPASH